MVAKLSITFNDILSEIRTLNVIVHSSPTGRVPRSMPHFIFVSHILLPLIYILLFIGHTPSGNISCKITLVASVVPVFFNLIV
ncbi:Uncharacterised protein [Clostridioides difficile]|nr:Uncharacterised protein [Clostridioides difficile]